MDFLCVDCSPSHLELYVSLDMYSLVQMSRAARRGGASSRGGASGCGTWRMLGWSELQIRASLLCDKQGWVPRGQPDLTYIIPQI
jgi:hypothetical protein